MPLPDGCKKCRKAWQACACTPEACRHPGCKGAPAFYVRSHDVFVCFVHGWDDPRCIEAKKGCTYGEARRKSIHLKG